jgi:hypothetical protein
MIACLYSVTIAVEGHTMCCVAQDLSSPKLCIDKAVERWGGHVAAGFDLATFSLQVGSQIGEDR